MRGMGTATADLKFFFLLLLSLKAPDAEWARYHANDMTLLHLNDFLDSQCHVIVRTPKAVRSGDRVGPLPHSPGHHQMPKPYLALLETHNAHLWYSSGDDVSYGHACAVLQSVIDVSSTSGPVSFL